MKLLVILFLIKVIARIDIKLGPEQSKSKDFKNPLQLRGLKWLVAMFSISCVGGLKRHLPYLTKTYLTNKFRTKVTEFYEGDGNFIWRIVDDEMSDEYLVWYCFVR